VSRAVPGWLAKNQRRLTAELLRVRGLMEKRLGRGSQAGEATREAVAAANPMPAPSGLDEVCAAFRLSPFEADLLLLCAGVEMSSEMVTLVGAAGGDAQRPAVTFALALALLPEPHWSAITPAAPLRKWRLVDVQQGDGLTQGTLRIDERVLHHLAGAGGLDERLQALLIPAGSESEPLPASLQTLSSGIARLWRGPAASAVRLQLHGEDGPTRRTVLSAACAELALPLYVLRAIDLPAAAADRHLLAQLWTREAALGTGALVIECEEDAEQQRVAAAFAFHCGGHVAISGRDQARLAFETVPVEVRLPGASEQRAMWIRALGKHAKTANGAVDRLISQFQLPPLAIRGIGAAVAGALDDPRSPGLEPLLWEACRVQARQKLDDLAQRLPITAGWDDLVLPEQQRGVLAEIIAQVRQRTRVYETWGFGRGGGRGLGISALFAGMSGTGKTMAAEVIAQALKLDLYRIDLSQVVSKYIGETEKNLRRIFDAAETSGAVLLFDEADALFGKRTEVKDSHDRYANIEVSYLLQRMESYSGLAILTTNLRASLDTAFVRRLRFIISFPFPDAAQRREIWLRAFPKDTPTENLSHDKLALLGVPGGNIRNIALNAAFLAAGAGSPVTMGHLVRAARTELAKMEKPLSEAEIGGWT
jgi:hypothetical protein